MNRSNWTLSILAAAVLLIQGCSGYGNPPPEPMGMAVQAMMQAQTQLCMLQTLSPVLFHLWMSAMCYCLRYRGAIYQRK